MTPVDEQLEVAAQALKTAIKALSTISQCEGYEKWTDEYKEDVQQVYVDVKEAENNLMNPARW